MMTIAELEGLRGELPLALKRGQVVRLFERCGLGGLKAYEKLKASGALVPLRGLWGAKQARYGLDHVLNLCAEALGAAEVPAARVE